MDRRAFLATAAGIMGTTLAGCFAQGSLSADEYDIGMSSNAFTPDHHTVSTGETVVWGNTNSRAHSVTAYENAIPDGVEYFSSGGFDTEAAARESWTEHNGRDGGKILTGQTYSHTFETPGTYSYFCIPHEQVMTGVIVVEKA